MLRPTLALLATGFAFPASALATDHLVDATGAESSLTTIGQAMAIALPGDRILVLPGTYPAFQFSRGVEVIGLGATPAEVVVARVDFHVSVPILHADAVLENLTVCGSGPSNSTSISGNELAHGTLVIHDVETCGGVFLHGGEFYLFVSGSSFQPGPGGGFLGAAFDFRGSADIVDSDIRGWDSHVPSAQAASVGLRIGAGAEVRLTRSIVEGGSGAPVAGALANGAAAIVGAPTAKLRIAGGSTALGGSAAAGGAGGAGVAIDGLIQVGDALVLGGSGSPPGPDFALDPPFFLKFDPELSVELGSSEITLSVDDSVASLPCFIGYATAIDPPALAHPMILVDGETIYRQGPELVLRRIGAFAAASGHGAGRAYFQASFLDPFSGQVVATNPVTLVLGD